MGGAIEDTLTEIVSLGSAQTETYNKEELEAEEQSKQATYEAEVLTYEEQLREEKFQTELMERMQTGGYRSLMGGKEVLDTVASGEFVSELTAPTAPEATTGDDLTDVLGVTQVTESLFS